MITYKHHLLSPIQDVSLVSDVGGVLGLFLGFAVMTIGEFFEFGVDLVVWCIMWLRYRDEWRKLRVMDPWRRKPSTKPTHSGFRQRAYSKGKRGSREQMLKPQDLQNAVGVVGDAGDATPPSWGENYQRLPYYYRQRLSQGTAASLELDRFRQHAQSGENNGQQEVDKSHIDLDIVSPVQRFVTSHSSAHRDSLTPVEMEQHGDLSCV